ncbi:MAG: serine/threonine protein kinase [Deltaproteobacteria bacterium]|nr:serine/threonine protein kinase [Deltaproteobacteria bacterium]
MEDLPRTLGRYQLIELLATGGMAHIYRARLASSQGTEKELVIKQVLPHLVQNRDFIDMFIDEARITMPLNHGNIVQVFEFGQEGQDYFLAMEYVRGRNLETVLERIKQRGTHVPIEVALFIASEVAKGLDYAHRFRDPHDRPAGIIHRDVSPQNILVGFQGEVKLTDFGIAKARSRIRSTAQGIIRGKACYLSPEQAECKDLDGRSDQFSLGAVLYEALTSVRPFEGDSEVATLQNVRQAAPQAPSRLRSDIPSEMDGAVLKALNREPERRFESCAVFGSILQRGLQNLDQQFTSATLADWMRQYFSDDITREITARTTKERMLQRLAQENGPALNTNATTGEILQMGTVSIQGETKAPSRSRKWIFAVVALVVFTIGVGLWAWWPQISKILGDGNSSDAGLIDRVDASAATPDALAGPPTSDGGIQPADFGPAEAATDNPADKIRKPPARYGYLNINSRPWAHVWIDGKRQSKETPIFRVRLRAGKHRLRFFNPELKIEKIRNVWVKPGRTKTITVELTAP